MPKGSDYDRLLEEFLASGGDLSLCPFDAGDYKWREPPHDLIGSDCDRDPVVDEVWRDIEAGKIELGGTVPTEEEWREWEREYEDIKRRRKS